MERTVTSIDAMADSSPVSMTRRRVVARVGLVLALLGFGGCLVWATEPRRRREILFESALRLRPGEVVTGRFAPDHDGPFVFELRFAGASRTSPGAASRESEPDLDGLAAAIGGQGPGSANPVGLSASYWVRRGSHLLARGETGDRFADETRGARELRVQLAGIDGSRPEPHDFELRIDRAVESLAGWDARLVVAASGDWIHYATVESDARLLLVFCAAGVLMFLVVAVALYREVKRPGPADLPREP